MDRKRIMPYGTGIIFDNENRFKDTYDSIHEQGSIDIWMATIKKIRKSDRFEPKIYIAGALGECPGRTAECLTIRTEPLGDAGKGKTVAIMLAASIWANPWGNDYITDPKSTMTALELRLDFLNNLPNAHR